MFYFRYKITLVRDPQKNGTQIILVKISFIHLKLSVLLHFDYDSAASFIPISRIAGQAAVAEVVLQFDYGKDKVDVNT